MEVSPVVSPESFEINLMNSKENSNSNPKSNLKLSNNNSSDTYRNTEILSNPHHIKKTDKYHSTQFNRERVRNTSSSKNSSTQFKIATWNVEGLTDEKTHNA